MTATIAGPSEFAKRAATGVRVTDSAGEICTLFVGRRDGTLLGWTYPAETGEGTYPATVTIAKVAVLKNVRVPTLEQQVIGEKYPSTTEYQHVWIGADALRRFAP
jgi:hypothetical protein